MRYYVTLGSAPQDAPVCVDVTENASGAMRAKIGEREFTVDVAAIGAQLSVHVDGKVCDMSVEGAPPNLGVVASKARTYVHVVSERARLAEQAHKRGDAGADPTLRSPMPGRVVKLMVEIGAHVEPGESLIVIEAMKMENEIKARFAGTVSAIHVTAGSTVEANAKLMTLSTP